MWAWIGSLACCLDDNDDFRNASEPSQNFEGLQPTAGQHGSLLDPFGRKVVAEV